MTTLAAFLTQKYHRYVLQLQGYIHAVLNDPGEPENLHKVRTTVRRIRTLLKSFKNEFDPEFLKEAKNFFKEIMDCSNEARDIDVFLQNFKNHERSLPPSMQVWIEPLYTFLLQRKAQEYEKLVKFFENPRLKEQLWRFSYPVIRQSDLKAQKGIKRAIKATRKELKQQKDLHRIRIVYKRLRYLHELLAEFTDVKKEIKRLKKIQDILGRYHDLVVQRESVYRFATLSDLNKEGLLAMGKLLGDLEQEITKIENKIKRKDRI